MYNIIGLLRDFLAPQLLLCIPKELRSLVEAMECMMAKSMSFSELSDLADFRDALAAKAAKEARRAVDRWHIMTCKRVLVRVPSAPSLRESTHVGRAYFETFAPARGGKVQLFFYDLPPDTSAGARVICDISIWGRTRANGEQSLYINCEVLLGEASPLHSLHIHSAAAQYDPNKNTGVHFCLPRSDGVIEIRERRKKIVND